MKTKTIFPAVAVGLSLVFCTGGIAAPPTLKDAFKADFLIGAALNPSQFCESNAVAAALVKQQFNSISPENVLKWERVHPRPGRFDFSLADRYVGFGRKNGMFIIGHNLIWQSQTPAWVFQEEPGRPVGREVLLERMRDHIFTVVGRYKGKIGGWDVVNEALAEDGSLNPASPWMRIIGPDYLAKAFEFAHAADPAAELYYNDFSMEKPPKRAGAVALIRRLKSEGITVAGIGIQGHYTLNWPATNDVAATIETFSKLGLKVMITELDVDVLPAAWDQGNADVSRNFQLQQKLNPYPSGLQEAIQQQLAGRYAELFRVFLRHRDNISRVTFWGVTDGDSWLNNWPVNGRTSYPLLFDREDRPKPAFDAVVKTAHLENATAKGD
jgi:endo-1,4-beta-xylanase